MGRSAPGADRTGPGSGADNAARNLCSAVGVTVVVVLSAHPEPAALLHGWDLAVGVTAAVSALGAIVVAVRWAVSSRGSAPVSARVCALHSMA